MGKGKRRLRMHLHDIHGLSLLRPTLDARTSSVQNHNCTRVLTQFHRTSLQIDMGDLDLRAEIQYEDLDY